MKTFPSVFGFVLPLALVPAAAADDKAPVSKPETPRIALVLPPCAAVGELTRTSIRGDALTNATAVRIVTGVASVDARILSRETAPGVEGYDAMRVGTQRIEVEYQLPANTPAGTNSTIVVVGPAGDSRPFPILIAPGAGLVAEKEPNNSLRGAPVTSSGTFIRGSLEVAGDVDVFEIEAEPGDTLVSEVFSERLGTTLDASMTLYDLKANVLASNDDAAGRDPVIDFRVTKTGRYFVAVSSVNEKAASTHAYVLCVRRNR